MVLQFYPIARLRAKFQPSPILPQWASLRLWPICRQWRRLITIVVIGVLATGLTACGQGNFPNQKVVLSAIARQVEQVQQPLSQQLKLKPPSIKDIQIRNLEIRDRHTTKINGETGYYLSGQYDLTLKQSDHQTTQSGDQFAIYLQPKQEGKVTLWQLAQKTGDTWQLETLNSGK